MCTAWVFFLSALLGAVDYWISTIMDKGSDAERFKLCCKSAKLTARGVRQCSSWQEVDWLFYATALFVVVGFSEIINAFPFNYSPWQNVVNSVVWTLDALLFLIDWFAWQEDDCCCGGGPQEEDEMEETGGDKKTEGDKGAADGKGGFHHDFD